MLVLIEGLFSPATTCLLSAPPTLDHIFPIALQAGTTNRVTAIGKFDPWPPKAWVDAQGIMFRPETNNGAFNIEVATNAPVGPHLVRLFNEEGASALRFLIVTHEPQLDEKEPNDDFNSPQLIEQLPATINGRLEKSGDVDSFAVKLQAGQTLIASVEAFTLASPVDAVLRLLDAHGLQQTWNHDDGRTLDPFLAWTAPSAGTYVLQVFGFAYPAGSDVRFTGNNRCVYRLHLSRGPYLRHTLPLGVQRGATTSLQLVAWNSAAAQPRDFQFDGASLGPEVSVAPLAVPGFENTLLLPVSDGPELVEHEPNDSTPEAHHLNAPFAITGCIEKPGDVDRFSFGAKKGEKLLLAIQSASLGFPLEARLRIENIKAEELAKNDEGLLTDPQLEWSAPEDGTFVVTVSSLLHRGGPDQLYRLSVLRALAAVNITVPETSFAITAGRTNDIKIAVKRLHGFDRKLTISAKGLCEGVTAAPAVVDTKSGDAALQLITAREAKPFSGPIQIAATEAESGKAHFAIADLTSSSIDNGVPGGFNKLLIETTDQFWLTVFPAVASSPKLGSASK